MSEDSLRDEIKELQKEVQDMREKLGVLKYAQERLAQDQECLEKSINDFAAKLDGLAEKIITNVTKAIDDKIQIQIQLHEKTCAGPKEKEKEAHKNVTVPEWLLRAIIGITTSAIAAIATYFGVKGG